MRISAWNCQGTEKSLTARALRAMTNSRNLQIVFIYETKCCGDMFWSKSDLKKG